MAEQDFNPFDSLVFLTNRVGRLLANRIRKQFDAQQLEMLTPHFGILVDLWVQDGVRQRELAISVIKDKATITRALDTMEKQGILQRFIDAEDKRNKRIFLTGKGRALRQQLQPLAEEVLADATTGLSRREMEVCKKVLTTMYDNLKNGKECGA